VRRSTKPIPNTAHDDSVFTPHSGCTDDRFSGQEDRYAGIAVRIIDENNYYVVRASASEQSVTFARFNNDDRQIIQTFPSKVAFQQWQILKVIAIDTEFQLFLNDRSIGVIQDRGWQTGKVGLGTKADSVTRFRKIVAKAF
jgi:hypothetical protein